MARTREFNPDEALSAAMRVFWAKGYGETSYDDLVKGTGVSRKGLYTAFGDKHKLFVAALRNYRKTIVPQLFGALSEESVTPDVIRQTFRQLAEMAASGAGQTGCFMARTSADIAMDDPDVKAVIDLHWSDLRKRLNAALLAAGYPQTRADQLAPYYVGVLQGLFTLAHARADRAIIEPFIEEALTALS
ncbi:TetR/AcrR family transcriptional regulator [Sulfitobacter sp. S190]|uniref:TetR/AcrR family transcriptional regulator n=1 Tax=Sulfitobacter sp. S190 TaxID=2867022 RepID=UPI0021A5F882|nr:TetR/AcrR family transcriptional regulator [Sulfitobacter sp. S190]UWR21216.1 TetR/AcrR family transcriptional regulator [Sulfitobacter sp. S190]